MERAVVLIVEDEALIRLSAAQTIEGADYAIAQAGNADEAIRILDSRRDIRAVFTDINMPGSMDGLKLAHAIRHRWPAIHLLVTSGLIAPAPHQLPENCRFLRKPYSDEQVVRALRELFAHTPAPAFSRKWAA